MFSSGPALNNFQLYLNTQEGTSLITGQRAEEVIQQKKVLRGRWAEGNDGEDLNLILGLRTVSCVADCQSSPQFY